MKVLIVFVLVAVFQGGQSATYDDLDYTVYNFLDTFDYIAMHLETVIDSMETGAQKVIDAHLTGAAPSACVLALQEELKEVSKAATTQTYHCIHSSVNKSRGAIDALLKSIRDSFGGLLGILDKLLTNIVGCVLTLVSAVTNITVIPADLLDAIVGIVKNFHALLDSEVSCTNAAIKAASVKIVAIVVKVMGCE